FQVDISRNPSLGALLSQLRGARVTVESQGSEISGTILGLEKTKRKIAEDAAIDTWMLNIIEGGTIRAVDLSDASRIELQDQELQDELSKALMALAQARDQDKKPVTIQFNGDGPRRVRVGYVVETPVWKTTYRLIMPEADDAKVGAIQGWAIVENQTESDWADVQLSLVSGRPISFIQDLYQPLYVRRPVVEPELYAGLAPQKYDGGSGGGLGGGGGAFAGTSFAQSQAPRRNRKAKAGRRLETDYDNMRNAGQVSAEAINGLGYAGDGMIDYAGSVSSLADAADMGELFQYQVDRVSLPRQRSAMIPIVTDEIEVERVSIYNQSVLAKHPLNGAWLTNSTGKELPQGPITVLDDGGYAGDARIDHFPPSQSRLLSYAVDLDVRVDATKMNQTDALQTGTLVHGVLKLKRKLTHTQTYAIENKGSKDKTMVLEHPRRSNWKLVDSPKPFETTETMYRFKGTVQAGKNKDFKVTQEFVRDVQMVLMTADVDRILFFAKARELPDDVRKALKKAIQLKEALSATDKQLHQHRNRIQRITKEQERIRANMKSVKQNSEYYTRLLTKLNDQETTIEKEQATIGKLQSQRNKQDKELAHYLSGLSVG
ncbi:MAG: hypothetical protein GXP29_10775, partial [Planctomycetes bacterium]|nr:hypothetical protein [Planctomycetota bacterium]